MSAGASTSAIWRFSAKSSSHSEYLSRYSVPQLPCYSPSVASSLLRIFAGSNEKDRSCEGDVDEDVVVELDDSPGATNGTKFWVLQKN